MAKQTGVKLREHRGSWQVDIGSRVTGSKRIQRSYPTKAQAVAGQAKLLRSLRSHGNDALDFTPENWRVCKEAIRMLEEKGFQASHLTEAASFFIDHNDPSATRKTVAAAYDEFMESKRQAGLAAYTIKGYSWKIGRFSKNFGSKMLHEITTSEIEDWLNKLRLHGRNRADFRRHLAIFWKFAISRNYARRNVASAITKVKLPQTTPEILTAQAVRALLCAARDHSMGRMLPYFAIGCFCGLRPWELRRTSWADIDLPKKQIYVTPEAAKTGQDRFVTMPDTLVAWLQLVSAGSRSGSLHYSRSEFNAIRKQAGVSWQGDIMRHSAASHLYAQTQNAALVTAQMGHGLNVFLKYYRRAVTQQDGEAYFKVNPNDPQENVVPFSTATA